MSGGLEPCRCSRPVRDAAPTIPPTIFCSDRLAAARWPWSPPLPTQKNPARCPRCDRLRGDRRETDATGRAERPSKLPFWSPPLTSPRPRCCPVRSQARQGGKLDRPVVLTRAAHNSDTWRGRPQSTPAPSALQCDSRTQSNGRSVVARSCPLRLVLLFVEPMQATRMSSKDASSVGRPSARSHASLLAHHLKRSAYTSGEGTSFGSLFDGVGENDGR